MQTTTIECPGCGSYDVEMFEEDQYLDMWCRCRECGEEWLDEGSENDKAQDDFCGRLWEDWQIAGCPAGEEPEC